MAGVADEIGSTTSGLKVGLSRNSSERTEQVELSRTYPPSPDGKATLCQRTERRRPRKATLAGSALAVPGRERSPAPSLALLLPRHRTLLPCFLPPCTNADNLRPPSHSALRHRRTDVRQTEGRTKDTFSERMAAREEGREEGEGGF